MTIPEGKRAIAQAVSANRVKARGPGHPRVNLPAQQPLSSSMPRGYLPLKDVSGDCSFDYPPNAPSAILRLRMQQETKGPKASIT